MTRLKPFATVAASLAMLLLVTQAAAAAPSWRLPELSGERIGPADFPGQWVVINYWATWCKPCRDEMPELNDLAGSQERIVVLGVAWEDATVEDLQAFMKIVPVEYPVLRVDPYDPPADIEAPRALPITVVYGPGGNEVKRFHGPVKRSDIERVIHGNGGDS